MTLLDKISKKKKKDQVNSKKDEKPDDARMLINQGNNFIEKRKYAEAVKYYNKAIKLTPDSISALNNKGLALARMEKFQEAVIYYNKALKINPDDVEIIFNKGLSLEKLGNYEKAILCYDDILDKKPGDADAWCSKGDVLFESGSFEEALLAYDRALELAPGDVTVLNNRGLVLYALNRFSEAVESYDKAIKVNPEIEKVRSNKNTALAKMKENGMNSSLEVSASLNDGVEDASDFERESGNAVFKIETLNVELENLAPVTENVVNPDFDQPEQEYDSGLAGIHKDTKSGSIESVMDENEENTDIELGDKGDENFVGQQPVIPEYEDSDLRSIIPVEVTTDEKTEPLAEMVMESDIEPENPDPETKPVNPDFDQSEPDYNSGLTGIHKDDIPVTESGSFESVMDENEENTDIELGDKGDENFVGQQTVIPEDEINSDLRTIIPVEVTTDEKTEPLAEMVMESDIEPENPEPEPVHPDFDQSEPDYNSGLTGIHKDDIPVTESGSFESLLDENEENTDIELGDKGDENFVGQQTVIPEDEMDSDLRTIIPVEVTTDEETEPLAEMVMESDIEPENPDPETKPFYPDFGQPEHEYDSGLAGIHKDGIPVTESGSIESVIDENDGNKDIELGDKDNNNVVEQHPVIPEDEMDSDLRTIIPVEVKKDEETEPVIEQMAKQVYEPENNPPETYSIQNPDLRHDKTMNKPEEHIIKGNSLFSKKKYKEAMDSYNKWGLSGLDD